MDKKTADQIYRNVTVNGAGVATKLIGTATCAMLLAAIISINWLLIVVSMDHPKPGIWMYPLGSLTGAIPLFLAGLWSLSQVYDRKWAPGVHLRYFANKWQLVVQGHTKELERLSILEHVSSRLMLALLLERKRLIQWVKDRGESIEVKKRIEWIENQVLWMHYHANKIAATLPEHVVENIAACHKHLDDVAREVAKWDSGVFPDASELKILDELTIPEDTSTRDAEVIPMRGKSKLPN